MSGTTGIQWTASDDGTAGKTLNPTIGCSRVKKENKQSGCDGCYAFALHDRRYAAWKKGKWPDAPEQYHLPFSVMQFLPERLWEPFRWRKPTRVFVDSMSDLFHDAVPDDYLAQVWAMMALTPLHTYQILTKRPERMRAWFQSNPYQAVLKHAGTFRAKRPALGDIPISDPARFPLPNVHLGTSVEDQEAADLRLGFLLDTPAAVHFISGEPLIGHVDLTRIPCPWGPHHKENGMPGYCNRCCHDYDRSRFGTINALEDGLGWVIVGGESGPRSRPMQLEWVEDIIEQCRDAGTPIFVKQLGTVWARGQKAKDRHGGTPDEWPEHLRIREWPHMGIPAEMEG